MMVNSTDEMLAECDSIYSEMKEITRSKSNDYGVECWQILGIKGVFADLNRKYWRIKNIIWDGNDETVKDEKIYDTVLDLANHCLQMAIYLRHKND